MKEKETRTPDELKKEIVKRLYEALGRFYAENKHDPACYDAAEEALKEIQNNYRLLKEIKVK